MVRWKKIPQGVNWRFEETSEKIEMIQHDWFKWRLEAATISGIVSGKSHGILWKPWFCQSWDVLVVHRLNALLWQSSCVLKSNIFLYFRLKEKCSHLFQDLCLYCEVSDILGLYTFRIHIRRFIQGLFANVNFDPVIESFALPSYIVQYYVFL